MPIPKDNSNEHHFSVNLSESDVKLLYNALKFYHENRPLSGDRPPEQQEPTNHINSMKRILFAMIMESNYHSVDSV